MSDGAGGVLDADVHCAVPSFEVLNPYLPDHWVEFFSAGFLRRHPAVSTDLSGLVADDRHAGRAVDA